MHDLLKRLRRPSPAMIVAVLALVFALGGSAYATTSLVVSRSATASSSFSQCRANVYAAFRFQSQGSQAERAAATEAICGKGKAGPAGATGAIGPAGATGLTGATGATGPKGEPGTPGEPGEVGPPGSSVYAEYYALMPPDNAATVPAGGAVEFPRQGPQSGAIQRVTATQFDITVSGVYRVSFAVPVSEPGQLELRLDGTGLAYTVSGRATGTSPIAGEALVAATAGSTLEVINPPAAPSSLTITSTAGGMSAASASLVFQKLG